MSAIEAPTIDRTKFKSFKPVAERFIEKVEITDGCWIWAGAVNENGYGSFWDGERSETASRAAYRLFVSPIPDGLFVLHRCDNPKCVKPSHLFLGSHEDNMRDRDLKGRAAKLSGSRNPSAKLTEDQAREIKLSSLPAAHFSSKFGIAESIVSSIRKGRTWKHL